MQSNDIKSISIRDYLKNQGIHPVKEYSTYALYKSPFRDEETASLKVDYKTNLWYDFGTSEGGSIIDLVMKMQQCNFIQAKQFLSICSFEHSSTENDLFSFQLDNSVSNSLLIKEAKLLEHPKLLDFLQRRKINIETAKTFCKEIHYQIGGRDYFALGFPNDAGGYELRNPQFKGCLSPKEITTFDRNTPDVQLFEGFMDYLSLLTLQAKQTDVSAVVLNSVHNLEKAIPFLSKHIQINAFLDNDDGGKQALEKLKNLKLPVVDISKRYAEYKDVNDFLIGKKLTKRIKTEVHTERHTQVPTKQHTQKPKRLKL